MPRSALVTHSWSFAAIYNGPLWTLPRGGGRKEGGGKPLLSTMLTRWPSQAILPVGEHDVPDREPAYRSRSVREEKEGGGGGSVLRNLHDYL